MSWNELRDLAHRTRNMVRRGYLLATYSDGKMLQARVKTGVGIENDKIDIMQPVGFASRLPAGPKVEVITADVNGDASKRVVLAVIGDRDNIPKVEEGESQLYAPGDPTKRVKASKEGGLDMASGDKPMSMSTDKGLSIKAKEGADFLDGAISIDSEGNVTFKGDVTIGKNLTVKGNITVTGTVTAADFITA